MDRWYYENDGTAVGPIDQSVMRDWVKKSVITREHRVRKEGALTWDRLDSFPELVEELPPNVPGSPVVGAARPKVPAGFKCRQHPKVDAVHFCASCGIPICLTCDFLVSGEVHVCPTCATTTPRALAGRTKFVVCTMILAACSTFALLYLLVAASRYRNGEHPDPEVSKFIGYLSTLIGILPGFIGAGLGIACFEKRLGNPAIVWVTGIWSNAVFALWVLLLLVGVAVRGE